MDVSRSASQRLDEIFRALCAEVSPDVESARAWGDEVARMAPLTWYACDCGPVDPTRGNVDAVCPKCGRLRRLPARLDFAPWSIYVRCVSVAFADWFDRLAAALSERYLLAREDGDVLECVDGMTVTRAGVVRAMPWIALPMPSVDELARVWS